MFSFPDSSVGKESICNAADPNLIPGPGRFTEEGIGYPLQYSWASLVSSAGKESTCNAEDLGLIPGLGKSPGEGNSYPLQYSCLENSMERGALWAPVHGVARIAEELATKLPPSFFFLSYKYLYYCQIQHVSLIVCLCLPMCSIQIISLSAYAPIISLH